MKKKPEVKSSTAVFERALVEPGRERYSLQLYVIGATERSARSVANIKRLCEEYLKGRYDLEVIDLHQRPALARGEQIVAAPTLIKKLPLPLRRIIGDFSRTDRALVGLDLRPKPRPRSEPEA